MSIPAFDDLSKAHRMPESEAVKRIVSFLRLDNRQLEKIQQHSIDLIERVRLKRQRKGGIHAFMIEYNLSSQEGIALMCLAEALLRVPDKETADELIEDKIKLADWAKHQGRSHFLFVNAATWGLILGNRLLSIASAETHENALLHFLSRHSKPVIRAVIGQAMKLLGNQFVLGQTISKAMNRGAALEKKGYRYSYDMLGEAARTKQDAEHYFKAYTDAIHSIGKRNKVGNPIQSAGISIKISALHPRYEFAQKERCLKELYPKLKQLAELCATYQIGLTLDAEEVDRLEFSLELLGLLAHEPSLAQWQGLGLAVQAYQKRAFDLIDWLAVLARESQRRLMVRLVKGAYWDSEIKHDQQLGLSEYALFTRKAYTDVSYLACAQKILEHTDLFYPQFATHNAFTVSAIINFAQNYRDFEFQCLHGMGDSLYDEIVGAQKLNIPCRIYAPVGPHQHLLAYLVRRLLENGANSSFVNQVVDETIDPASLVLNPVDLVLQADYQPHPQIPNPLDLYGETRVNARGIDLNNQETVKKLLETLETARQTPRLSKPLVAAEIDFSQRELMDLRNPANTEKSIGQLIEATPEDAELAIKTAKAAFESWSQTPVATRSACLKKAADLLEAQMEVFMQIAIDEAGKSIPNAIGEVREAIDFCRYYAAEAERLFSQPMTLPGYTGETNQLHFSGRGVVVCISPWNFPLAIFLGQVTAALAAGNAVIAKPSEQTTLIAYMAVELLHQAGIPKAILQFVPGPGSTVGAALTAHPDVAGVIFTGSTETARLIQKTLSAKEGPMVPFIAETGGQNCLIADSSTLPEQLVQDVLISAFDSAGQRCSALRVLYVQEEIANTVIHMLAGAMAELNIGDPSQLSTDIGPVIDAEAQANLQQHIDQMRKEAKLIAQTELKPTQTQHGHFIAPVAFEISNIAQLKREVFGPVLHVIRYNKDQLDTVIEAINATGYGLTFGIHSRIQSTVDKLSRSIKAGNIYVNRNIVGAVVGVQPFGGEGLSGTGPKAGGPHYLLKLCTERTLTINTTAAGGNASLMTLSEAAKSSSL